MVLRAFKTFSELVTTFMPASTGRTQEAARTRAPVSTTQRRQTPTGVWFCRWQSVGTLMPFMRAASKTLVPAGTRTSWPSRVMSTKPGGVVSVVMLRANSYALGFPGVGRRREANSAGALALQNVRVDFWTKMFQYGLNRRRGNLTEAADRSQAHGLRKFIEQREVGAILRFGYAALRPSSEHVRHFLRADAAGDTFAAGFVAIEARGIEGHVQHASGLVADDDSARTEHGACFGKGLEVETNIGHRSGKEAGRRAGWREGFQGTAAANATGMIENDITHRRAHGDFENSRMRDMPAYTDKLQSARAIDALRDKPIDPAGENLRDVDERFDIINDGGFLPEADLAGERRLVARLG